MDIRQVADVFSVLAEKAVLFVHRVEMIACRFERRLTFSDIVDMDSVRARRNPLWFLPKTETNQDPVWSLRQRRLADLLSVAIGHFGFGRSRLGSQTVTDWCSD